MLRKLPNKRVHITDVLRYCQSLLGANTRLMTAFGIGASVRTSEVEIR